MTVRVKCEGSCRLVECHLLRVAAVVCVMHRVRRVLESSNKGRIGLKWKRGDDDALAKQRAIEEAC